jgi:hypothetical protein
MMPNPVGKCGVCKERIYKDCTGDIIPHRCSVTLMPFNDVMEVPMTNGNDEVIGKPPAETGKDENREGNPGSMAGYPGLASERRENETRTKDATQRTPQEIASDAVDAVMGKAEDRRDARADGAGPEMGLGADEHAAFERAAREKADPVADAQEKLKAAQREAKRAAATAERKGALEHLRGLFASMPAEAFREETHDPDCAAGLYCETFLIGVLLRGDPTKEQMEAAAIIIADSVLVAIGRPPLGLIGKIKGIEDRLKRREPGSMEEALDAISKLSDVMNSGVTVSSSENEEVIEEAVRTRPKGMPEDVARALVMSLRRVVGKL